MNIYKTLLTEYYKRHNNIHINYLSNLDITITPNISDDLVKRYIDNEYTLFLLGENFTSEALKEMAGISKNIYGVDYIGYPELTTFSKANISFPDYELNDEQMNFIFEGIRYIYDNYEECDLP